MDRIEERAKKSIHQHYNCDGEYPCTKRRYCVMCGGKNTTYDCTECGADEFYEGYVAGATEQKKIDSDEFKKLVVWKLGSAHDAYVRSNPQDESYTKGKFDALDELYKELIGKRNPLFDSCLAKVDPEIREEVRRNMEE